MKKLAGLLLAFLMLLSACGGSTAEETSESASESPTTESRTAVGTSASESASSEKSAESEASEEDASPLDSANSTEESAETAIEGLGSSDLENAANEIRKSLKADASIPAEYVPEDGFVLSHDAFIDENPADIVLTAELLEDRTQEFEWGFEDGTGDAIVETIAEMFARFESSQAVQAPAQASLNEPIGKGNTVNNLAATFPEADVVEFHTPSENEESFGDWQSVSLAIQEIDGELQLVGLTAATWTI